MSKKIYTQDINNIIKNLVQAIDDNHNREGLRRTPERVAKFYEEFLTNKTLEITTFKNEGYDEMVAQCNIPFYSLCEHHMVPFFGVAHIAYIPNERIIGLSKLSRIIDNFAHRLQNQERITTEITDFLESAVRPNGVAVSMTARHLCMEMRGIRRIGAETTTTSLRGVFKNDERARNEFLQYINAQRRSI